MKASFLKRLLAYTIDILLVSLILSTITLFIPNSKSLNNLDKELQTTSQDYAKNKISTKVFANKVSDISYDINMQSSLSTIIDITLMILCFIVFQYYNKGQTLGKKLMKIKVVGCDNNELNINDYIFRCMIINSILFNLLNVTVLFFANKNIYMSFSVGISLMQFVILVITAVMVMVRKDGRGLHDMIGHSKVVEV